MASAGDALEQPLPIRFHILFHAAIRAELDRLDEEVRRIEAQPVGAKDFRALGLRCRFLHDVYQYHSRLEDEVRALASCRGVCKPGSRNCRPSRDLRLRRVSCTRVGNAWQPRAGTFSVLRKFLGQPGCGFRGVVLRVGTLAGAALVRSGWAAAVREPGKTACWSFFLMRPRRLSSRSWSCAFEMSHGRTRWSTSTRRDVTPPPPWPL